MEMQNGENVIQTEMLIEMMQIISYAGKKIEPCIIIGNKPVLIILKDATWTKILLQSIMFIAIIVIAQLQLFLALTTHIKLPKFHLKLILLKILGSY